MIAEHNQNAVHIPYIAAFRAKYGLVRKTDEQREAEYIAKLDRLESVAINVKRVIINRNEVSA